MDTLRPAGLNEKRCIVREHLNIYNTIVSVVRYHGAKNLHRNDLVKALKSCIVQHPALAIVVTRSDTESPQLSRPASIDLNQHLELLETDWADSSLQALLTRLHNEPVVDSHERPQWRVTAILPRPDGSDTGGKIHVAFACSHALFDGMSLAAFQSTFLQALRNLQTTSMDANPIYAVPSDIQALPPMEKAGSFKISWSFLLGPLVNEYFPKSLVWLLRMQQNIPDNVWLGALTRPAKDPQQMPATSVHVSSVSAGLLKRALSACKAEKVRLTALLQPLLARALTRSLKRRGLNHTSYISQTAINLRQALGKGEGQMANYVSGLTEPISVDGNRLGERGFSSPDWDSARRLTKRLGEASQTLSDQPVGLLAYLSNYTEWTLKNAAACPDVSFEISNLGVFDGKADQKKGTEEWAVEEMAFSQSANAAGQPLSLNVASTKGGSLMLVFTWWPGMLGVADEDVFVREVGEDVGVELEGLGGKWAV